jgi:hypothetical protein
MSASSICKNNANFFRQPFSKQLFNKKLALKCILGAVKFKSFQSISPALSRSDEEWGRGYCFEHNDIFMAVDGVEKLWFMAPAAISSCTKPSVVGQKSSKTYLHPATLQRLKNISFKTCKRGKGTIPNGRELEITSPFFFFQT